MAPDYDALLNLTTEIGYRLLVNGAEIYRVEESIQRLLKAYGSGNGEVFVIPSCIIVSLTAPGGHPATRVRRVYAHNTDIYRLEAYNDLCRVICEAPPDFDAAEALMRRIEENRKAFSYPEQLLGYFLGTAAFSVFFGGTWRDGLCSGICGVAIGLCLAFMTRLGANSFFRTIAGGAASATLALLLTALGLGENADTVIIGAFMALVPGVIFTNAMRDIMAGDLIAGISKLAEALLIGAAIALGAGFALAVARGLGG